MKKIWIIGLGCLLLSVMRIQVVQANNVPVPEFFGIYLVENGKLLEVNWVEAEAGQYFKRAPSRSNTQTNERPSFVVYFSDKQISQFQIIRLFYPETELTWQFGDSCEVRRGQIPGCPDVYQIIPRDPLPDGDYAVIYKSIVFSEPFVTVFADFTVGKITWQETEKQAQQRRKERLLQEQRKREEEARLRAEQERRAEEEKKRKLEEETRWKEKVEKVTLRLTTSEEGNVDTFSKVNWSPNGKMIAFVHRKGSHNLLSIMNLDNNSITSFTTNYARDPIFSPDNTKVVFTDNDGRGHPLISLLDLGNNEIYHLTKPMHYAHYPVWSPDSKKIALISGGNLSLVNVNNKKLSSIIEKKNRIKYIAWDSSGENIILNSEHSTIYNLEIEGLYMVNINNKELTELSGDPINIIRWSPDRQKIFFADNLYLKDTSLYVASIKEKTVVNQLGKFDADIRGEWLDNKKIVLTFRRGRYYAFYIMDTVKRKLVKVIDLPRSESIRAFAPFTNNQYLITTFYEYNPQYSRFLLVDGTFPDYTITELINTKDEIEGLISSPDKKKVLYQIDSNFIHILYLLKDAESSKLVELIRFSRFSRYHCHYKSCSNIRWSPDGKSIIFLGKLENEEITSIFSINLEKLGLV